MSDTVTIRVEPGSELDRALENAGDHGILLERNGTRYRVTLAERLGRRDLWKDYDPEAARRGMREAAGSWSDVDADALIEHIYRAREEGSRPADRP